MQGGVLVGSKRGASRGSSGKQARCKEGFQWEASEVQAGVLVGSKRGARRGSSGKQARCKEGF